jgi:putative drug exporter of the RND superfamily
VARGTTGAPRNTPGQDPGVQASGPDTGIAQHEHRRGQRTIGVLRDQGPVGRRKETRLHGVSRLIAIVCGRRSKYLVVAFWVLGVVALGSLAGKLQGAEKNDSSAYLPSSAESTQELNEQNLFQSQNLNPALVVYVRPGGVTAADMRKAEAQGDPGLSVKVGGPAASAADELKIFKGIDSTLLYAALGVVFGLLLLTYRSPVLWLLPIVSAGVALAVAEAVIYLLTQHANLTVNGQSDGILVVLVIGASTDYALLLIARYREELRRHADRHEAMAVALRRAGPAIIASGLTVVTGMLCLLAAESNDISGLGPVAAVGIAVGLIAMITLLPALLVVFGRWIFWPVRPGHGSAEPTSRGVWSRVGQASVDPPVTKDGLSFVQATMTMPPDSPAAYTLVDRIRTTVHAIPGPRPRWAAAPPSTRTWRPPRLMTGIC